MLIMLMGSACGGAHSIIPNQPAVPRDFYLASAGVASIRVGATIQFTATGTYSLPSGDSSTDLTNSATWATSDASIATVGKGLVTGTGIGSVLITATFEGKSDSRKVVVSLTPTSIVMTPTDTKMFRLSAKGAAFYTIATYSDGTTLDLTDLATWTSQPTGILKFSPYLGGDAEFLKTKTTTITATFDSGEAPTKEVIVVP